MTTSRPHPLAYAAALWLPVAFVAAGTKVHKATVLAHTAGHGPGLRALLAILSGEALFYGAGLVLWAALLGSSRRRVRVAAAALLHVTAPAMMGLLVAEHAYFRASGALADWFLFKDALRGFGHLTRLYRGELSPTRAVMLAAPWLYSAGVLAARLRRAGDAEARPSRLVPAGAAVVLVAACARLLDVPPALLPLRRSALGGMLADALADAHRGVVAPAQASAEKDATTIGPTSLGALGASAARNAVVIALESTGAGATSLYGGAYDTTPFLRDLGARGAVVERAYTTVPHTSKALVSLLCGVMPKPHPGVDEADRDAIPARCLPALLKEHGYATAFFQPAEENYERRADLVHEMGFDSFFGKESLDGTGFDESSYFGWEDEALARPIDAWLAAHAARPFLLTVLTLASHHPYALPRGATTRKLADAAPLNDYLNTVAYTDRFLRGLFQAFERRGLLRDTVFVVLGDHGEAFGQHGRHQHDAVPYEEGLRIPMVLAGPAIGPGRRIPGLRQLIDVAPTLAGQLGFQATPPFAGKDLLSTLGHERIWTSCYLRDYCTAELEGWQKVIHHHGRQADQLFDLRSDPSERHDLTGEGRYRQVERAVRRMTRAREATQALYDRRAAQHVPSFVTKAPPALPLTAASARFEDFAELTGFDVQPRGATAGGVVTITSVFHVLQKPDPAWELFLHLDGPRTLNADHVPAQGAHPVGRWEPGDYVVDRHRVALRPATEPERFQVKLGFWQRESKVRAAVAPDATDAVDLGAIDVRPPPLNRADFVGTQAPAPSGVDITFGRHLRLVAAQPDRKVVKAGLPLTITTVFQTLAALGDGLELRAELIGAVRRETPHVPVGGAAPLATIAPGQVVRDPLAILTRTGDTPGTYRVVLALYDKARGRRVLPAGRGLPITEGGVQVAEFEVIR